MPFAVRSGAPISSLWRVSTLECHGGMVMALPDHRGPRGYPGAFAPRRGRTQVARGK